MFIAPVVNAANWWENIKIKGDLRYRHEMLKNEDENARHRHRLRARVGVFAEANENINIGIQMATGSDDPVSTNQTLDDAFSTKDFGLDMAYFTFHHEKAPGFKLTGGKFKNPFFKPGKSELIWDSDWNPEGGVINFEHSEDNFDFTLIGAGLWIDERSSSDDSYLAAGQGVGRLNFNEKNSSLAIGAGFFNYVNTEGFEPFFDSEDGMGNSTVNVTVGTETVKNYVTDYEILEIFIEAVHKFNYIPVTLLGDYVTNTSADSLETGWLVGLRVGKAKRPGSWEFRYIYREVKRDAVVGIFTDSDFRGGGTDAKGYEFGGAYQLDKNAAFKFTYFVNEIGLQMTDTENFQRMQIDLQLKF
jgi:hypothetical protein